MANPYGRWVPDSLSASGFRWQRHDEVPATTMLPIVEPTPSHGGTVEYGGHQVHALPASASREFHHDDGSVYGRVDPDEFDSYDDVDSTTIVDPGAPD